MTRSVFLALRTFKPTRDDDILAGYDEIVAFIEPDKGGKAFLERLALSKHRDRIRAAKLDGFKDISELHCGALERFDEVLLDAIEQAQPLDAEPDNYTPEPDETPETESNRPVIKTYGGSLSDNADEGEYVLRAADVPIFRQRGTLVRPLRNTHRDSKGNEVQVPAITGVTSCMLRDALCINADFQKFDGRAKKWVKVNPPMEVADTILSRKGEGKYWRTLAGVTGTPFLRPDASIASAHGFDNATGMYILDPVELPPMPKHPNKKDALQELTVLKNFFETSPLSIQKPMKPPQKIHSVQRWREESYSKSCRGAFSFNNTSGTRSH